MSSLSINLQRRHYPVSLAFVHLCPDLKVMCLIWIQWEIPAERKKHFGFYYLFTISEINNNNEIFKIKFLNCYFIYLFTVTLLNCYFILFIYN